MMTFCALLKTEPVGDALQLTALLQSTNDDDDDDDVVGGNIVLTDVPVQLMTGKRAERTKCHFWCSICLSAIGHPSCLICTRRHQLTFPFYC